MFGATVSTPLPLLLEIPRAAEFREPNAVAFSSIYIYLFIYFGPYVVHVPLTRYAQTSDRPVEVQRSI